MRRTGQSRSRPITPSSGSVSYASISRSICVQPTGLLSAHEPDWTKLQWERPHLEQASCVENWRPGFAAANQYEVYTGWSNVMESMVATRSPFCGYNTIQCVDLKDEDLLCYSNKIELESFFNVHRITDLPTKCNLSAISQWQIFLRVLPTRWRQKSAGIDMEQNHVTVTLCIVSA